MEPAGRVALVTGSGRRLGRALALALGAAGARVAVHYHESRDGAQDVVSALRAQGAEAAAFGADLFRADAPAMLVDAVRARFGTLEILVNSAAIMERAPLDVVAPEDWDRTIALNLRAPFFCAVAFARALNATPPARDDQAGERGVIINIADLAGLESWTGYIPHGISKAGVLHMTRSLARALAPGVRVNAIAPGTVLLPEEWPEGSADHLERTTPLRRHGAAEDVVEAMLYLIRASYVTGETVIVDGGRHIR